MHANIKALIVVKHQRLPPTGAGNGTYLLESVDCIFFCGDLNYRLDIPQEVVEYNVRKMLEIKVEMVTRDVYSENLIETTLEEMQLKILCHNQLLCFVAERRTFPGFSEGKITFPPLFIFDKGTKDYNTSLKQRIPAWTDCVLFIPEEVRLLEYWSIPVAIHSDHRPVVATF